MPLFDAGPRSAPILVRLPNFGEVGLAVMLSVLLGCSGGCSAALAEVAADGPVGTQPPLRDAPSPLPAARWHQQGLRVEVELAIDPALSAKQFNALAHYAIGLVAVPVMLVQPQIALGLPFYLVFAAPWQSVFNARAETLAQVLAAEPLPSAVVAALREQWPQPPRAAGLEIHLRLAGYGLIANSGRKLEAFEPAEDLCLVADGRLEVSRDGMPMLTEDLAIGPLSTTRDAPPPLCAPMSQWAAAGGMLLRQATRELAETLAALIADRVERLP